MKLFEALRDYLGRGSLSGPEDFASFKEFHAAVMRAPDVLRKRTVVSRHRAMITNETFAQLEGLVVLPLDATARWEYLVVLYAAAVASGDAEKRVRACARAATLYLELDEPERADTMIARAVRLGGAGYLRGRVMELLPRVASLRAAKDLTKAVGLLDECLVIALRIDEWAMVASIRKGIAQCCCDLREFDRALEELAVLSVLFDVPGGEEELLRALNGRADVLKAVGRFEDAAAVYRHISVVAQRMGDRRAEFVALNSEATSYIRAGKMVDAHDRFVSVLRTVEPLGDPIMTGAAHNNIGQTLLQLGRPAEALEEFQHAAKLVVNSGAHESEMNAFLGIADAYFALGDLESARATLSWTLTPVVESGRADLLARWALHATRPGLSESTDAAIAIVDDAMSRLGNRVPVLRDALEHRRAELTGP